MVELSPRKPCPKLGGEVQNPRRRHGYTMIFEAAASSCFADRSHSLAVT